MEYIAIYSFFSLLLLKGQRQALALFGCSLNQVKAEIQNEITQEPGYTW